MKFYMKDEVITIRVTSTTYRALKYLSLFHDLKLPELVRLAIDDYIANDYAIMNQEAAKNSLARKYECLGDE